MEEGGVDIVGEAVIGVGVLNEGEEAVCSPMACSNSLKRRTNTSIGKRKWLRIICSKMASKAILLEWAKRMCWVDSIR